MFKLNFSFSWKKYVYPTLMIIFAIVFLALIWYGTPIIKERYFPSDSSKTEESEAEWEAEQDKILESENLDDETTTNDNENETSEEEADSEDEPVVPDTFLQISNKDCDNRCKSYSDADEKKYCQEVCCLTKETVVSSSCSGLEDLEKDYCFKNLAIEKKDASFCQKISDTKVKKLCQNRVFEDAQDAMSGIAE